MTRVADRCAQEIHGDGLFLQTDPVGYEDQMNMYAYVGNDPMNMTDPTGKYGYYPGFENDMAAAEASGAAQGVRNVVSAVDTVSDIAAPLKGVAKLGIKKAFKAAVSKLTKGNCCFVAGTQVLTESGYKNIEDVKLGERLWAKNVETGEQDWKPVIRIFVEPDRGIYKINLIGNDGFEQKIEATDDHPFYVIGEDWKTTIELVIGDYIETDGNGEMMVTSVIDEKREDLTYNFTIADFHTYYVTERRVLVHNCPTGSYTNTHASGKTYDGKGDPARATASAKRVEKQHGDPAVKTETRTASSDRESFKQESQSLDSNGGAGSNSNYNKIETPGKKYRQQDGEI